VKAMKVCAHINYGPFNRGHERFDSVGSAVAYFAREIAGEDFGTGTDEQVMDLYPVCDDCDGAVNFHDYPMVRYSVGPRGGIRRERG
jgi:hypothetical protein